MTRPATPTGLVDPPATIHSPTRQLVGHQRLRPRLTRTERLLVGLELFLAGGALAGSGGMLLDPSGRGQGLPADLLDGTPFHSFLIPGFTLLVLNGLLPGVVAVSTIRRHPLARIGHLSVAVALAGWLVGETALIGLASWMQPFFFAYALVVALLAMRVWQIRTGSSGEAAMTTKLDHSSIGPRRATRPDQRRLAYALAALGAGLALNTVLGPLLTDTIRYPFSESLRNQTIGLEAVSLFLVAPLCVLSALLIWRGHRAGPVLALGPGTYSAYMFLQYLIGPGYLYYPRVLPLHLGLFVLSGVVAVGAWSAVDAAALPAMPERVARRRAGVVLVLAAFIVSRYVPALFGSWHQGALAPEFAREPAMFWSVLTLDLGIVVPGALYVAAALRRGQLGAAKSLYALLEWFALVPPSVAAMAVVMILNDDPNKAPAGAGLFVAAAIAFGVYAVSVFRPLFGDTAPAGRS